MGCGRVGSQIAKELDQAGHSVAVIDSHSEAFDKLDDSFSGQLVTGNGIHRSTLERAGIDEAYAFAAVSRGDNSNMVAVRTVDATYDVTRVVARIADPERAQLCERLGIPTVASAMRTSAALMKRMLPPSTTILWEDATGSVSLCLVRPSADWIGKSIQFVERATRCRVTFISRLAEVIVAHSNLVVQDQDELYVGTQGTDPQLIRRILSQPPKESQK